MKLLWCVLVIGCHHGQLPPPERNNPCDQNGPPEQRPHADLVQTFEATYVAKELFADERDARTTCTLPETIVAGEDDALKTQCTKLAGPCRRVCLITGRATVAVALYEQVMTALRDFKDVGSCAAALPVGRSELRGDDAVRFWHCLGKEPLPRRMELEVTLAADRHVDRFAVELALIPDGGTYEFAYGNVDVGCGHTEYAVVANEPRFE